MLYSDAATLGFARGVTKQFDLLMENFDWTSSVVVNSMRSCLVWPMYADGNELVKNLANIFDIVIKPRLDDRPYPAELWREYDLGDEWPVEHYMIFDGPFHEERFHNRMERGFVYGYGDSGLCF